MNRLLAAGFLVALATPAAAHSRDVSRFLEDNDCTAYLFTAAHPQMSLKSPHALWIILNMGPSDVLLSIKGGRTLWRYEPWDGGGSQVFAGDKRYKYLLSLDPNGKDTKVYVCIPR